MNARTNRVAPDEKVRTRPVTGQAMRARNSSMRGRGPRRANRSRPTRCTRGRSSESRSAELRLRRFGCTTFGDRKHATAIRVLPDSASDSAARASHTQRKDGRAKGSPRGVCCAPQQEPCGRQSRARKTRPRGARRSENVDVCNWTPAEVPRVEADANGFNALLYILPEYHCCQINNQTWLMCGRPACGRSIQRRLADAGRLWRNARATGMSSRQDVKGDWKDFGEPNVDSTWRTPSASARP
ncbi:hypothetical protein GY45DRAFT_683292 [Cubamyces sp. BRFM 1775]|nr:hypothetical protein GY45DRAFT_683292 [Cubamyces sp. BRFM 1775]